MDIGLSGLASGFDWRSMLDQLVEVERAPQRRLQIEKLDNRERSSIYGSLKTELSVLQGKLTTLSDADFFGSRSVTASAAETVSAQVSENATVGTYSVNVSQMASASTLTGSSNLGSSLNSTSDVSGLTLSSAAFPSPVTAGTITINGAQVTISTTDSLQTVFDNINSATGGVVSGSYAPGTDLITLSSSSEIVLGSTTDTSNFFTAARLFNNGTGTVSSSSSLGSVNQTSVLSSGNFTTAINDGGSGAGQFTINGVAINFDVSSDSLENVISRINSSGAEVFASYDTVNDQITLTNKKTGDLGVAIADVTGNFASALGLGSGTLARGNNLTYTVNGGGVQTSFTNTVTGESSGINGLTFTAHQTGTGTVTVGSDRAKIEKGITDFVAQYNKVQSFIDANTASTTNAAGKVSAGPMQSEQEVLDIAAELRSLSVGSVSALSTTLDRLSDIGIETNGYDNKLAISDTTIFSDSLINDLGKVTTLFQDSTDGIAVLMNAFVEKQIGDEGVIPSKVDSIAEQDGGIDDQIAQLERVVQSNRERLMQSFISMETAQSQINNQLKFLQQRFGGGTK